ncbi:hypothetical protein KO506_08265 [Polaribacter vadi]|uniref:hypothetical protein n=1 Tax=Polaribacter TaxID=52959 RepID=UPI001C08BEE1|nr:MULTISPECIES: hypothetical protein [Polaribacter]MBU3011393.1 hypothetical protein [Polaribacter vadi]MDO6741205.1 hypothetical protein [Polaribacter sp. 1_MG-2023]
MQTRDYDDYVYISSTEGFRKVDDSGSKIDENQKTDGYCNLYADNISLSYLHSMSDIQINAIHYFEENYEAIFKVLLAHLSKKYKNPKLELGFSSMNVLHEDKNEMCFTVYTFIDKEQNKIHLKMHKNELSI